MFFSLNFTCYFYQKIWFSLVLTILVVAFYYIAFTITDAYLTARYASSESSQQQYNKTDSVDSTDVYFGLVKNDDDIRKKEYGYEKFAFNLLVSDRIGYRRDIPDTRNKM